MASVAEADCWSLLLDETADVSRKEQLVLIARYVDGGSRDNRPVIRERFLSFCILEGLTGAEIADKARTLFGLPI